MTRHCVKVKLGTKDRKAHAKHSRAGAKLAPVRFYGCFKSKSDAEKVAKRLRNAKRI